METMPLFDVRRLNINIERSRPLFADHNFLYLKSAAGIADRLSCLKNPPASVLVFGERDGTMQTVLKKLFPETVITSFSDTAPEFPPGSFDCIVSNLCLHRENNIRELLFLLHGMLKPGGVFISSLFGENTLADLRHCLIETEISLNGKVSPRIHPSVDIKSAGALLQAAGFLLPVADCETYTVVHNDVIGLIHDLRGMGETNALTAASKIPLTEKFFDTLKTLYAEKCGCGDGTVETRFDILYIIGWKE